MAPAKSHFSLRTNAGVVVQTFNEHLPKRSAPPVKKVTVDVSFDTNQLHPYRYMWQKQNEVVDSMYL